MDSIWKPVVGHENYQVSDMGEVRNARSGRVLKHEHHRQGYRIVCLYTGGKRTKQYIHRLVAFTHIPNTGGKSYVDHIHGIGAGDMVSNLRWATLADNNHNRKINKTNTTGFKGVSFDKRTKKYIARIRINKKQTYLGTFNTGPEAHTAYCKAASTNYGEFAHNG